MAAAMAEEAGTPAAVVDTHSPVVATDSRVVADVDFQAAAADSTAGAVLSMVAATLLTAAVAGSRAAGAGIVAVTIATGIGAEDTTEAVSMADTMELRMLTVTTTPTIAPAIATRPATTINGAIGTLTQAATPTNASAVTEILLL
jgi:hypothetical protein